jgi:prophage regulatory protein
MKVESPTSKKLISIKDVCRKTTLSRTALWKAMKTDAFPKPVMLGEGIRKAFLEHEIDAWIDGLAAMRDKAGNRR